MASVEHFSADDRYIAKLEAEVRSLRHRCDEKDARIIDLTSEIEELGALYRQKTERLAAIQTLANLDD